MAFITTLSSTSGLARLHHSVILMLAFYFNVVSSQASMETNSTDKDIELFAKKVTELVSSHEEEFSRWLKGVFGLLTAGLVKFYLWPLFKYCSQQHFNWPPTNTKATRDPESPPANESVLTSGPCTRCHLETWKLTDLQPLHQLLHQMSQAPPAEVAQRSGPGSLPVGQSIYEPPFSAQASPPLVNQPSPEQPMSKAQETQVEQRSGSPTQSPQTSQTQVAHQPDPQLMVQAVGQAITIGVTNGWVEMGGL